MNYKDLEKNPDCWIKFLPFRVIWMIDTSFSANYSSKMAIINNSIEQVTRSIHSFPYDSNDRVKIRTQAITFDSSARWHIQHPMDIEDMKWPKIYNTGAGSKNSAMSDAFDLLNEMLEKEQDSMLVPPVIILVSANKCHDNWLESLRNFNRLAIAQKSFRFAVELGVDSDRHLLQKFVDENQSRSFIDFTRKSYPLISDTYDVISRCLKKEFSAKAYLQKKDNGKHQLWTNLHSYESLRQDLKKSVDSQLPYFSTNEKLYEDSGEFVITNSGSTYLWEPQQIAS